MYLDHQKQLAYIGIPKTATYSVNDYFGNNTGHPEPYLHHMNADLMVALYPRAINYKIFSFVRNPWDRLVSAYFDFTRRRFCQYSSEICSALPLLHEWDSFEDFCLGLEDSYWRYNVFFRPQVSMLTIPGYGLSRMFFVGKFENLQDDLNKLSDMLGLPKQQIGHNNIGFYNKGYQKYYTEKSRQAIENIYKMDIKEFGYEF